MKPYLACGHCHERIEWSTVGSICDHCHEHVHSFYDSVVEEADTLNDHHSHRGRIPLLQDTLHAMVELARGNPTGHFACNRCRRLVDEFWLDSKDRWMRALCSTCYISTCYQENKRDMLTHTIFSETVYTYDKHWSDQNRHLPYLARRAGGETCHVHHDGIVSQWWPGFYEHVQTDQHVRSMSAEAGSDSPDNISRYYINVRPATYPANVQETSTITHEAGPEIAANRGRGTRGGGRGRS